MSLSTFRRRVAHTARPIALVSALSLLGFPAVRAQKISYPGSITEDTVTWHGLRWRDIGIFRGGRSIAVAGSAQRPFEFWMGTTGGGVFKIDQTAAIVGAGHRQDISAERSARSRSRPSAPDVVYVGGGEYADPRQRLARRRRLEDDRRRQDLDVRRDSPRRGRSPTSSSIRPIPTSCTSARSATSGRRIRNAASSARRTAARHGRRFSFETTRPASSTSCMDPNNPNVLYAGFWQAGRTPWMLSSGGNGSGMCKTTDGGDHWTEITRNPGLPRRRLGQHRHHGLAARTRIASGRTSKPTRAACSARTTRGETWRSINSESQSRAARLVLHEDPRGSEGHERRLRQQRRRS